MREYTLIYSVHTGTRRDRYMYVYKYTHIYKHSYDINMKYVTRV